MFSERRGRPALQTSHGELEEELGPRDAVRDGADAPHEELGLHLVLAHDLVVGAHLCDKQIDDTRLVVAAVAAVELPLLGECGRDALALGGGRIPRPAQELRLARHGDGDRADIFELRGPHRN